MTSKKVSSGTVHKVPKDIREVLVSDDNLLEKWNSLTPLARNEWICWVISVKRAETRADHLRRLEEELLQGQKRPCCWIGCIHRTDKEIISSVRYVIGKGSGAGKA